MERLWAPWRMKFIEELRDKGSGCIFCELAAPGDDRKRLILHRGESCYAVMNRYPYNNGHMMVVPYRHEGELGGLAAAEHREMLSVCAHAVRIMRDAMEAEGFNIGLNIGAVAGAGVADHIHMHLVPRWRGDSNFLPVLGETKCMPEYLEDTYARLIDGFSAIGR
ncbi:MAG: HIT domain-containing protein [Proteobacteria bacterium]|nr:HIT domain-containing protein [Pseudomonadota bacterium]